MCVCVCDGGRKWLCICAVIIPGMVHPLFTVEGVYVNVHCVT